MNGSPTQLIWRKKNIAPAAALPTPVATHFYIRHGPKMYDNQPGINGLDPDLTEGGIILARDRFVDLIQAYCTKGDELALPDIIISSPYLRAHHTAVIAQEVLTELTGCTIPIVYDSRFGEYVSKKHNQYADDSISVKTRERADGQQIYTNENWNQMQARVRRLCRENQPSFYSGNTAGQTRFIISHGVIIQSLSKIKGGAGIYPDYLHGVMIRGDSIVEI